MDAQRLAVDGARVFVPRVFPDARGLTISPFQVMAFTEATGRSFFRVAQTLHSTSRRNVVRGVHFTAVPPGGAKYVYCSRGAALDVIVDLRVASPTFGRHSVVRLDGRELNAVYIPVGVGHAFAALEDDTVMSYLLSAEYVAENERTISLLDPNLGLPIPLDGIDPIMSERDRAAVTLAEAAAEGLLPDYERCRKAEEMICSAAC